MTAASLNTDEEPAAAASGRHAIAVPAGGSSRAERLSGTARLLIRQPLTRLYLAIAATGLGFGTGLISLADGLRFSAATGELVMVPVVVTVLLHLTVRRYPRLWDGRLGHGDYVGAGIGVAVAIGILWWHPTVQLNDGAVKRLDLLALPLALAAGLVLMLGLRVLVVGMFPLLFAFLAWPYPWIVVETGTVADLAALTYRASGALVAAVGVGQALPDAGDNVLRIGHGAGRFEISVAPACSGFTGLVAALIMCGAALFVLRGRTLNKLGWLLSGLLITWLATLLRILLLGVVGALWGSGPALQGLHPVAGLLLDSLVFLGMLAIARRFGLHPEQTRVRTRRATEPHYPPPRARAVVLRFAVVLAISGLFAAMSLTGMVGSEANAQAAGVSSPVSLASLRRVDPRATFVADQPWSKVFFGDSSTWNRYRVQGRAAQWNASVWVDSIVVTDPKPLAVHSVLDCYIFHRSTVAERRDIRLGSGLAATVIVVRRTEGDTWYSLHWQRPVTEDGGPVHYERVVLMTAQPARAGAYVIALADDGSQALEPSVTIDPRVVAGLTDTADRLLRAERG